jgi:hypothetical protein
LPPTGFPSTRPIGAFLLPRRERRSPRTPLSGRNFSPRRLRYDHPPPRPPLPSERPLTEAAAIYLRPGSGFERT